jgi:signal transduction histidine kinase
LHWRAASIDAMKAPPRQQALTGIPRATIHDLRTPLTSIRGYAQLLLRGVKSEEQARRAYQTIFRESERLARMLDQLARVAEVALVAREPEPHRFDLSATVSEAVAEARERWPAHRFVYEQAPPATVLADARYIRETLATILDNAAGYSEGGTTIEVQLESQNGKVCVAVRDQGIGIPADELDSIFESFQRGSNAARAPSSAARGLGIGLFLARAALEEAGGRIWAESEPDAGATFHIALPLAE